ncbi:MAG: Gx transporter family protein [Clostridia bacterium]|nr:Gx transporter family protein [Clostridia bacterium]
MKKKYSNRERTRRIALCGLLIAMMLVLGFVESRIPINVGIPGIKLGLSNGVLIFAVYMLDIPTAWLLMVLKVMLSALLFGGFNTIMYALAGGVLSMLAMTLLSKVRGMHPITVSMVGGVMHNVGQVALAMILLHTQQLLYYMAVLILVGLICGALTGIVASSVMKHLKAIR